MDEDQAAKELLFGHIDIVKGDGEAESILDCTYVRALRSRR